jgi:hypothetical protein
MHYHQVNLLFCTPSFRGVLTQLIYLFIFTRLIRHRDFESDMKDDIPA